MSKVDTNENLLSQKTYYNYKVLIGPWYEETEKYCKNIYNHNSTYKQDFQQKLNPNSKSQQWSTRLKNEGLPSRLLFDIKDDKYLENFSSSSDLSYNHIPNWEGYKMRKLNEQPRDLLMNYGNITNFGLLEWKKQQWMRDSDEYRFAKSQYKNDFLDNSMEVAKCNNDAAIIKAKFRCAKSPIN